MQQAAFFRLGEDRFDHVLAFGQRCDLGQVGVRRLPGEVLLEVVGCHCGVDEAVFDLHGDAVLVMHDQRVEHPLAFTHVQGQGALGTGGLFGQDNHLAAVLVAAGGDLIGNVVDLEQCRTGLGLGDKGADALHAHQQTFGGQRRARLMVMRLKPNWLTSSLSDGTR
ncbi:hypothetical protein D3C76_1206900 [compost metagenome]